MMSNVTLPPPLPPMLPAHPEKIEKTDNINDADVSSSWEQRCNAELQRLVELEQRSHPHLTEVVLKYFQPVLPIAQNGPTCGMVALSMGLSLTKNKTSPEELIKIAQSSLWTTQGEMFSCEWMANLARSVGANAFAIKSGIDNHLGCFLSCLKQGGSILVPYDKDKNHAPFLGGGTSAHWAVVTGILFLATSSSVNVTSKDSCFLKTSAHCSTNLEPSDELEWKDSNWNNGECVVPYLVAFQGKGNRLYLWPFTLLAKSNGNLSSVGEKHNWVLLPPDGIKGGLLGQAVLLY